MLEDALIVVGGYLIGSIPSGVVLVRLFRGEDIRRQGSGNIGASNVWRTYGRGLGIPVALLDVAKGFVPVLVGLILGGELVGVLAGRGRDAGTRPSGLARVPQGGQDGRDGWRRRTRARAARRARVRWRLARTFFLFRYASLASLVTAAALPLLCLAFGEPWETVLFVAVAAMAVFFLHRHNIARLVHGTEPRFTRGARPTRA